MLIDFTVENFRSFREPKQFSLVASSSHELPENVIDLPDHGIKLLRTAAIYGANASGKSNLLAAMHFLGDLLDSPTGRPVSYNLWFSPFALDRESGSKPSSFNARFFVDGIVYEYFIALRAEGIHEERLSAYPLGREQVWFHRKGEETEFNRTHLKGQKQSLLHVTPPNKPFLTIAAAFEHQQLSVPARWLITNLRNRLDYRRTGGWVRRAVGTEEASARLFHENDLFKSWASAFLQHADVVHDVEVEVVTETVMRPITTRAESGELIRSHKELKENHYEPYFYHTGDNGVIARFGLSDESLGTRRLFSMLAPFYNVLVNGHLAIVDELSASIHPSMVREIVRLFHDSRINKLGAQLVFATHDTTLLSGRLLRRDQVWFTEKNKSGVTDLYSLNDIKGVRDTEAFEKGYLRGRYGAIPFFGEFDFPEIPEDKAAHTEEA